MLLTNDLNLPDPIVRAVAHDDYGTKRGTARLTVSQLIAPPRQVALLKKHGDTLSEDVSDRIWSLLGQVTHGILERAELDALTEMRLSTIVEGWTISGQFDRLALFPDGLVQDYKLTSVWAAIDGVKPEWVAQLNCYAHLIRQAGGEVDRLQIVAILRDWSKGRALAGNGYPPHQVQVLDVPLWSETEALAYMVGRVRMHQAAEIALPPCSDDDVWRRPTTYAVMRAGRKRAVKLCATETEAQAVIGSDKRPQELSVTVRPGVAVRCESYCAAAPVCTQWLGERAEMAADDSGPEAA